VPFTARHQLANLLAAVAAAQAVGVEPSGRVDVSFGALRGEHVALPSGAVIINDCYNANPLSMRAALAHLAERAGERRRLAVLGEMAELGPRAAEFHREIGRQAADLGVEVIAVGALARNYGGRHVADAEEAAAVVADVLRPGDVVLVKGSRSVGLEIVAENFA